jgi:hypothetical protein
MAVVSTLCIGKTSCQIVASCSEFHEKLRNPGAFCWAAKKVLGAKVSCKRIEEAVELGRLRMATPGPPLAADEDATAAASGSGEAG